MDPLATSIADVADLIFQHLNAKDVMNCSLVSKSWYEIIGSSSCCMRQIWIRIDRPSDQVELLGRSARKYENLRIQPGLRGELSKVLKYFRPKSVEIVDEHNENLEFRDYFSFMSSMAGTVEELHPGEGVVINARNHKPISFKRLRELQYTVTNRAAFSIFCGSNPKLVKVLLSFSNEILSEFLMPDNIVHTFLQSNPQIKNLWICEISCAFQSDLTEGVHLDLETFAFAKTTTKGSEKIGCNLIKFIKAQRNLEWLKILGLNDRKTFSSIWSEGKFKKLFIMDCSLKNSLNGHELATNVSVVEINFYLNPACHILKFLRATPNLAAFKVRQLSKQILEFCARNLPKLEKIQFQSVESGVTKFYEDLKAATIEGINTRIILEEMNFFEFVGRDAGF